MQGFLVVVLAIFLGLSHAFVRHSRVVRGQMSMMARKPIMAGNWKMNTDLEVGEKNLQLRDFNKHKNYFCYLNIMGKSLNLTFFTKTFPLHS